MESIFSQEPLVSIKGKNIKQIGIIVEEAEKTAIVSSFQMMNNQVRTPDRKSLLGEKSLLKRGFG